MFSDPKIFFLWLVISLIFYWFSKIENRPIIILISSVLILFILFPGALLISLTLGLIALIYGKFKQSQKKNLLKYFIFATIFPLVFFRFFDQNYNIFLHFGITFVTLRCVSLIIDSYVENKKLSFISSLNYITFFPLFSAGPIENNKIFYKKNFHFSFNLNFFFYGNFRLLLGLFKSIFICDQIIKPFYLSTWPLMEIAPLNYNWFDVYTYIFFRFIYTYINFSAYCDIAIGASAMFGFKIRENFNYPFLATSIQDFWRRWHLTLGTWITQYLYFPLLARFRGKFSYIYASIITFLIIGFWHNSEPGYIFWGLFHGIGLAYYQFVNKKFGNKFLYKKIKKMSFYKYFCIICTLTYVSWLQTIANMDSFSSAMKLTSILFFIK